MRRRRCWASLSGWAGNQERKRHAAATYSGRSSPPHAAMRPLPCGGSIEHAKACQQQGEPERGAEDFERVGMFEQNETAFRIHAWSRLRVQDIFKGSARRYIAPASPF